MLKSMSEHGDEVGRIIRRATLPGKLSREVATGANQIAGVTFDPAFYEEVRVSAARWQERAGNCAKVVVLVPPGLFALAAGFHFPDQDISLLGIGYHRFFLFHSGISIWMMRKVYEAYLARNGDSQLLRDRVVKKILGVAAGGFAFGVGCHLLVDTLQPKAVVFPFFGSLIDGTMVDDNLWLLCNALWCFKISHDLFALALGDDLPKVKAYVHRTFVKPIGEGLLDAVSICNR